MTRTLPVFFLIISVSIIFLPYAQAEDAVIPMPENYLPKEQISEYLQDAYAYLTQNSSSPFSSRVALDLLMVADRIGNKSLAEDMKVFLIFEHTQSLQGAHVLTTFKNAQEIRDFILEHVEDQLSKNPVTFPDMFARIIESGLSYFKDQFLGDGNFLLISYCVTSAAGAGKTAQVLLPALVSLSQEDARLAGLMDICLDERNTAAEKIIKLHGQDEDTRFLETFYLSTLTESEKNQPSISRILISNAIKAKDYKTAQSRIDAMPDSFLDDPQVLFWQGWVQYSLRKDHLALQTFSNLSKKYPKSKWATTAIVYLKGIRNVGRYHQNIAHSLFSALEVIRNGIGILQAKVNLSTASDAEGEKKYAVYIGLLPENNFLEMILYRNEKIILAYRTSRIDSAIYLASRKKIITFNEPAAIPVPSVSLLRDDDGVFTLNAGLEFFSSINTAGVKTSSLFESPYLSTLGGVYDLVEHAARRHGWVPVDPVTKNDTQILIWQAASIDSPDLKTIECNISENAIIKRIKFDSFSIDDVQYSKKPTFKLSSPPWPPDPIEKSETFSIPIFMEFMGMVIQFFGGEN